MTRTFYEIAMTTFVHSFCSRHVICVESADFKTIKDLKIHLSKEKGFPLDAYFFICNGSLVEDTDCVETGVTYHTLARILGGKGGFGSMLRAIGAQIEKTTNHEACRDLSGRRMRDVNNEKELKEWLAKQADKEKEREQRRQERLARRRAVPNHKFDDPLYDQQRSLLAENQEDALQKGLKRAFATATATTTATSSDSGSDSGSQQDREIPGPSSRKIRKTTEWLGVDIDDLSDLESEEDEEKPGSSKEITHKIGLIGEVNLHHANPGTSEQHSSKISAADTEAQLDVALGSTENQIDTDKKKPDSSESMIQETDAVVDIPFDLDHYSCAEDLEVLGLDKLKFELMSRGLKCGGTLQQRAERLFSIKGLPSDQINSALLAKPSKGKAIKK